VHVHVYVNVNVNVHVDVDVDVGRGRIFLWSRCCSKRRYSWRNAMIGATPVARQAGKTEATYPIHQVSRGKKLATDFTNYTEDIRLIRAQILYSRWG